MIISWLSQNNKNKTMNTFYFAIVLEVCGLHEMLGNQYAFFFYDSL